MWLPFREARSHTLAFSLLHLHINNPPIRVPFTSSRVCPHSTHPPLAPLQVTMTTHRFSPINKEWQQCYRDIYNWFRCDTFTAPYSHRTSCKNIQNTSVCLFFFPFRRMCTTSNHSVKTYRNMNWSEITIETVTGWEGAEGRGTKRESETEKRQTLRQRDRRERERNWKRQYVVTKSQVSGLGVDYSVYRTLEQCSNCESDSCSEE